MATGGSGKRSPRSLPLVSGIGIGLEWWNDRIVECWVFCPPGRLSEIGFVLHNQSDGGRGRRVEGRGTSPVPPGKTEEIGFVFHILPSGTLADRRNWVCFAQSPLVPQASSRPAPPALRRACPERQRIGRASGSPTSSAGARKLGSFCTFSPRPTPLGPHPTPSRRELGSFCIFRPPGDPALPTLGGIGFVSHILSHQIGFVSHDCFSAAGAVQIGFVCTAISQPTTDYRLPPFGFVSYVGAPRGSGSACRPKGVGGSAESQIFADLRSREEIHCGSSFLSLALCFLRICANRRNLWTTGFDCGHLSRRPRFFIIDVSRCLYVVQKSKIGQKF